MLTTKYSDNGNICPEDVKTYWGRTGNLGVY